jgi:tyrosine-protein kinase Etk/Wzc
MSLPIQPAGGVVPRDAETPLASYIDVLVSQRWVILSVIVLCTLIGAAYALFRTPVYQADIAVQVEEESPTATKSYLGDVSSIFDIKPAASGEMEVLRSRSVVSTAVDTYALYIHARPRYLPLAGEWLSRRKSPPAVAGKTQLGGYVWGKQEISVSRLDVPQDLIGENLRIESAGDNKYVLTDPASEKRFQGTVGSAVRFATPSGPIDIQVDALSGEPGSTFVVRRNSKLQATEALQAQMAIFERGKQSGVIGATLKGSDPVLIASVLNEIGRSYVKQNADRKAAQARSSLAFIEAQLPDLKRQLETAENRYNSLRNRRGTVDLSEEAKLVLGQSVETQTKIFDLKAKRQELIGRFTPTSPTIVAIDRQIASLSTDVNALGGRIRGLPDLEQDVVRLQRDVSVNTALYTTLLNNTQQLKLVSAGKVGNVRLIDEAAIPEEPLAPKSSTIVAIALLVGAMLGVLAALMRNAMFGGLSNPTEVERFTGLPVLSAIPYSPFQDKRWRKQTAKAGNTAAAPITPPQMQQDAVIATLRTFRTALGVQLRDRPSNVVAITGPVAGVGKSFLSANFAMVQAAVGKRVLLIDADFRRGRLNRYFGVDEKNGLAEYLTGKLPFEQTIRKNLQGGVDLVTAGRSPEDTSELLSLPAFGQFLQRVSKDYDMVIIDTPPVLFSGEASMAASYAAATLIVVRSGVNTVGEVEETAKRLAQAGARVEGVLFNGFKLMPERYGYRPKYGQYQYARSAYYLADH